MAGVAGVASQSHLLAVDVGNTNVTIGAFKATDLVASWRISTDRRRMADEYVPLFADLLASANLGFRDLDGAVIASVVPPVIQEIQEGLLKRDVSVIVLTTDMDLGVPVRYHPPSSVGVDRLANALAVQQRYGQPAIIVDLGTATTLDVLDRSGVYVGGAIAPGIETSLEGLFSIAFQLPRLALQAPPRAIGSTTVDSIRSGTLLGYASLVDGMVERFQNELESDPVVVGTGGLAPLVAPQTRHIGIVDSELTLHGLRIAHDRLKRV